MSVPDTVRHGAREVIFESYPEVGFNYRHDRLQAAVGREQLKRLPDIVATRGAAGRPLPRAARRHRRPAAAGRAGLGAQQLAELLRPPAGRRAISARVMQSHARRRHLDPPRRHVQPPRACRMPSLGRRRRADSERAQDHTVMLPLYIDLDQRSQAHVVDQLIAACTARVPR